MEGQIFGEFREYTKWCGGVCAFLPEHPPISVAKDPKFCGASCDLEI